MAVPKFFDFFYPVLVVLENQGATKVPILRQKVADLMKLTVEEREQLVPSGTQSTYGNRVAWALSYMKKAQLVKSPLRGTYEITPAGRRALIEVGDRIDLNYLNSVYTSYARMFAQMAMQRTKTAAMNPSLVFA